MTAPGPEAASPRRGVAWTAAAVAVFALATGSLFHELGGRDLTKFVPVAVSNVTPAAEKPRFARLLRSDVRFVSWLVARNAGTLVTRPWELFDPGICHPASNALAFSEPAITLGIVAIPAWLATRDPIATYNFVLVAITWIAAFAIFLLLREWTGDSAAGIAAGLLYAFHETKLGDLAHVYLWDNAWTALALLFATRLVARRRWRDSLGLGLCISLQVGTSLYPLLSAALISLPILGWLLVRSGLRGLRIGPWALAAGLGALASVAVFAPYLDLYGTDDLKTWSEQLFMPFAWLAPGGPFFPGWFALALAPTALILGGRRDGAGLRWVLFAAALLTLNLAMGGSTGEALMAEHQGRPPPLRIPNLYAWLAVVIPWLDVSRGPLVFYTGTHLALCLLAGLGAAALLRRAPTRWAPVAGAFLIAAAYVDTLRPASLGLEPRFSYEIAHLAPEPATLAFFETLAARDNDGPILELPVNPDYIRANATSILLSAYHGRRTSRCYIGIMTPPRVIELSRKLPDRAAVLALRELGFTTIVVHHEPEEPILRQLRKHFERFAASDAGDVLTRVHTDAALTAYAITAAPARGGW